MCRRFYSKRSQPPSAGRSQQFLAAHSNSLQHHLTAPNTQAVLVAPPPHLPAFCRLLENVVQSQDGSVIWGTVKDMAAFDKLLSTIQDEQQVQFSNVRTCRHATKAGVVTVRHDLQCRMAGNPSNGSLHRKVPIRRRASIRSLKCGCSAAITLWDSPGKDVEVELELQHTGHVPGALVDKSNLQMHPR